MHDMNWISNVVEFSFFAKFKTDFPIFDKYGLTLKTFQGICRTFMTLTQNICMVCGFGSKRFSGLDTKNGYRHFPKPTFWGSGDPKTDVWNKILRAMLLRLPYFVYTTFHSIRLWVSNTGGLDQSSSQRCRSY